MSRTGREQQSPLSNDELQQIADRLDAIHLEQATLATEQHQLQLRLTTLAQIGTSNQAQRPDPNHRNPTNVTSDGSTQNETVLDVNAPRDVDGTLLYAGDSIRILNPVKLAKHPVAVRGLAGSVT